MKYLWYGFLGLFSIGILGLIAGILGSVFIVSYYGHDLPDYNQLKDYKPPIVTRLYAGDGQLMAEFAQEKRVFVPVEKIPDLVKDAFIAAEDQNFYTHEGVDFFAILRAVFSNIKNVGSGKRPIGASTITQQVAKNFLLTNEVSIERKVKEAILAYRMERAMSKDRLLELYMNEIYLGARAYGVAAASLQYFNKSLDELSIAEMAFLAALPKAPNNYNPQRYHDAAQDRRNWVIGRMEEDGYITKSQASLAIATPLETVDSKSRIADAPFFTEEVRRELAERYGEESLYGGGLVVRSTLDPHLQEIAVRSLRKGLMEYDRRHGYRGPAAHVEDIEGWKQDKTPPPEGLLEDWRLAIVAESGAEKASLRFKDGTKGVLKLENAKWARKCLNECYAQGPEITAVSDVVKRGDVIMVSPVKGQKDSYELMQVPLLQGAVIALDPHTGRVLAMQGGWKYGVDQFNRATQAQRQPGSAFKPFVYLTALDKGFTPATLILDAPFVIEDRPGHFWSPTNYSNEYYGPTPLRVGVEKSRNLMTVRLADYIGMESIADTARRFGVMDDMPLHLANALGAGETTLLKMTAAYAVFVNGGKKVIPSFIDRVQDRRGATVFRHDDRACQNCGKLIKWEGQTMPDIPDAREQIDDPRTCYQIVSIMEGVVQRGTAVRAKALGRPLAGKTGTTNESKDTWFMGFSPDLVVGVFMGFDEPRSVGKRETGSSVALPVFMDVMGEALKDVPPMPFRIPPGIRNIQINADTGVRAQPGDQHVIWESFLAGTEPTDQMYILDGRGISQMPEGGYEAGINGPVQDGEGQEQLLPSAGATTGTGGLY